MLFGDDNKSKSDFERAVLKGSEFFGQILRRSEC
jgi:hypothetical protein